MLSISKAFTGSHKKTFSQENERLIKRAYPYAKGQELQHIQKFYDGVIGVTDECGLMRQRVEDHLRGRVFGVSGVAV